jgi:NADPH2:quinone reductase
VRTTVDARGKLLLGGGYAEYVAVDARHALPAPPGIDLQAAAVPGTFLRSTPTFSNVES